MKATTTVTLFIITFLTAAGWSTVDVNAGDSLSFLCLGCRFCNCCTKPEPIIEPATIEQPTIEQPIIEQPIKQPIIAGDRPLPIDLKHVDGKGLEKVLKQHDIEQWREWLREWLALEHERNADDLSFGDPAVMRAIEKFMEQHQRNADDLSFDGPAVISAFEKFMDWQQHFWRVDVLRDLRVPYWGTMHWGTSNFWGEGPDWANFIDYAKLNHFMELNWIHSNYDYAKWGINSKNYAKNYVYYYWIHWIHWINLRKHRNALTTHAITKKKKKKNGGQCVSSCNQHSQKMGDICVAVGLSTVLFFSMVLILRVFRNLERQKKTSRKTHVFQIDDLGGVSNLPG